ncbi:MAG: hypothetical protein A2144_04805 [Chloroflexi bacterium RBG_16_50_9]|nr:MAG: hypothetical protein A2144_04805 [Chloroflexi bacterium RBG_16_50_9]
MKNLTLILVAAAVVLLVAYAFLGMDYLKHRQQYETLGNQIAKASQTLDRTPASPQDLALKLAAAEASLASVQDAVPKDLNSTQIINTVLKLADACQVKVIPLVTKPWSVENIGQAYHVFRLNIIVKGSFSQLTSFVNKLEDGEFKSIVIEDLDVIRAGDQSDEPVTARIALAIYAQFTTTK